MKRLIRILTAILVLCFAGVSWGAGYHATGLTPEDSRCSFATNDSWLAWDSLDFSAYGTGNWFIRLHDSSGAIAEGFSSVVGTEETFGSALNTNTCVNAEAGTGEYDTFDGATSSGFHAIRSTIGTKVAGTTDQIPYVTGQLFNIIFTMNLASGAYPYASFRYRLHVGSSATKAADDIQSTGGSNAIYITSMITTGGVVQFKATANTEFTVSNLAVKQVIEPAATGIHILDGIGGSEAWAKIEAGFDFNDIVEIEILPAATLAGVTLTGVTVN